MVLQEKNHEKEVKEEIKKERISVLVHLISNKVVTIEIEPNEKFQVLRRRIFERDGLDSRLICNGKEIAYDSSRTLEDLEIKDKNHVQCMIR